MCIVCNLSSLILEIEILKISLNGEKNKRVIDRLKTIGPIYFCQLKLYLQYINIITLNTHYYFNYYIKVITHRYCTFSTMENIHFRRIVDWSPGLPGLPGGYAIGKQRNIKKREKIIVRRRYR